MGRLLRPRLPGVPFHITARTQGQEPLFEGAERYIAELIRGSVQYSDAELLAYAVMRNHIHVVVVHGRRPLSEFMQPLLRRIALLVNRRKGRAGHVFQGRYAHVCCHDPEYFRSMIAYVHLNPVRAGLVSSADRYAWTSHRDYARGAEPGTPARYALAVEQAVRVFASASEQTHERCRRDYRAFIRWRMAMDLYLSDESDSYHPVPRAPLSIGGDLHWHREFGSARPLRIARTDSPTDRALDLRDHILITLKDVDPQFPMELLRSGGSTRPLVRVRSRVVARALSAGYTGKSVAEFLNISPTAVSRLKSRLRQGLAL
ncbi:MAG TPA: transposase [Longimicrobiales bacterium]|nr:transposase [Longimicrobiales bacterium]